MKNKSGKSMYLKMQEDIKDKIVPLTKFQEILIMIFSQQILFKEGIL